MAVKSAFQSPEEVVPLAARTTGGNSGVLPRWGGRRDVVAKLVVTAVSGAAPTLTVTVEHADAAAGPFTALDTLPVQSAVTTGVFRTAFGNAKPHVRVAWTIGGTTPSFTFSVTLGLTHPLLLAG